MGLLPSSWGIGIPSDWWGSLTSAGNGIGDWVKRDNVGKLVNEAGDVFTETVNGIVDEFGNCFDKISGQKLENQKEHDVPGKGKKCYTEGVFNQAGKWLLTDGKDFFNDAGNVLEDAGNAFADELGNCFDKMNGNQLPNQKREHPNGRDNKCYTFAAGNWLYEEGGELFDKAGNEFEKFGDNIVDELGNCLNQAGEAIGAKKKNVRGRGTKCYTTNALNTAGNWLYEEGGEFFTESGEKIKQAGNYLANEANECLGLDGIKVDHLAYSRKKDPGKCIDVAENFAKTLNGTIVEGIEGMEDVSLDVLQDAAQLGEQLGYNVSNGVMDGMDWFVDISDNYILPALGTSRCKLGIDPDKEKCDQQNQQEYENDDPTGVIDKEICDSLSSFDWDSDSGLCVLKDDKRDTSDSFQTAITECSSKAGSITFEEPIDPSYKANPLASNDEDPYAKFQPSDSNYDPLVAEPVTPPTESPLPSFPPADEAPAHPDLNIDVEPITNADALSEEERKRRDDLLSDLNDLISLDLDPESNTAGDDDYHATVAEIIEELLDMGIPLSSQIVETWSNPELFISSRIPFIRLGPKYNQYGSRPDGVWKNSQFRLKAGPTGHAYTQHDIRDINNAASECETRCRRKPKCPGFTVEWHTDKTAKCLVYHEQKDTPELIAARKLENDNKDLRSYRYLFQQKCNAAPFNHTATGASSGGSAPKPDCTYEINGHTWWRGNLKTKEAIDAGEWRGFVNQESIRNPYPNSNALDLINNGGHQLMTNSLYPPRVDEEYVKTSDGNITLRSMPKNRPRYNATDEPVESWRKRVEEEQVANDLKSRGVDPKSSKKESENPENFTSSTPFKPLGNVRLKTGASGYPYSQFITKEKGGVEPGIPKGAVDECQAKCKTDPTCPGISMDRYRDGAINCMTFRKQTGEASHQSCVYPPFGGECVSASDNSATHWRGTRTKTMLQDLDK